jgi:hypothetical protein
VLESNHGGDPTKMPYMVNKEGSPQKPQTLKFRKVETTWNIIAAEIP